MSAVAETPKAAKLALDPPARRHQRQRSPTDDGPGERASRAPGAVNKDGGDGAKARLAPAHAVAYEFGAPAAPTPGFGIVGGVKMTEGVGLGKRTLEPPVGQDMGLWAAGEVTKHEELCGLRYESIAKDMAAVNARAKVIEDKINAAVRYVIGIVGSLCVALIVMAFNFAHSQHDADQSDKMEIRARLSLLTSQLQNFGRGTVVVAPAGTEATAVPPPGGSPPINPDELGAAVGAGKQR